MIVKLSQPHSEYPDLTPNQPYLVIGIEADDYRLLNDNGRPYLYPHEIFQIIDPHEPADWIVEIGNDGERYAYPASLNSVGFFEDFFDGDNDAVSAFWHEVNQQLAYVSTQF